MAYVTGQGFEMGLRLGETYARQKKEKAYQEERARALAEAQAQDRAQLEGVQLQIGNMKQAAGLPEVGPLTTEQTPQAMYFDRLSKVVAGMSPAHRERFVNEEQERQRGLAMERAQKKVAAGVAERRARGAYNFVDETEPNPEIDAKLDALTEALDSGQISPVAAAELEAKLLEAVRKENERRHLQKRGTALLEGEISKARASSNSVLSGQLETLAAAWGTQELDFDDLTDRLFEIQTGRQTARAAGPSLFEVKQEALKLWQAYEQGPPTEEGLQKYIRMLTQGPAPMDAEPFNPERGAAREMGGMFGAGKVPRGTAESSGQPAASPAKGKASGQKPQRKAAKTDPKLQDAYQRGAEQLAARQAPAKGKGDKAPAKGSQGGLPPRPWAKLEKGEQQQATKDLEAAAARGADLRVVLRAIGITDPENLPGPLKKRLIELAKKAARGTGLDGPLRGH